MLRHAYLILAHEQPNHLRRLCAALDAPGNQCFAHFDASRGPCPSLPANARVVPDPLDVNHGGFSLTSAMLSTLKYAQSLGEFDFFTFLSGRDYPLQSNKKIAGFLEQHAGQNFINFYRLNRGADYYHHVSQRYFVDARARVPNALQSTARNLERVVRFGLPERKFPAGLSPYRGSAFFTLANETAHYVLNYLESPEGTRQLRFFRRSWGSDEMLFQSIILNSPHAARCRFHSRDQGQTMANENNASLHYIDWDLKRERPAVLDERDLEPMLESGFMFARKFDEIRSEKLLASLDELR